MCKDKLSMNYEKFKKTLLELLEREVEPGVSIKTQKVLKNNGVYLEGLYISAPDLKVSPTFYIEQIYRQYLNTGDLDQIIREILLAFKEDAIDWGLELEFFKDFNQVKEKLAFRLINYEENENLLKTTPHRRYLDLAIVYYCLVDSEHIANGMVMIREPHLKLWNVTEEDLYRHALINTPSKLPVRVMKMANLLERSTDLWTDSSVLESDVETLIENIGRSIEFYMYILTNDHRHFGAAAILYPGFLHQLANMLKSDLYILPSSIHEVIVVPQNNCKMGREELEELVRDVNDNHVDEEELLSYQIYSYDWQDDCIG